MIDTIATVERNTELAPGYRLLTLNFDRDISARAGQFAMLRSHDCYEPLLRRALAIYRADSSRQISFLYQVLGRGTEMLSTLGPGGKVDVLIPLGNAWLEGERELAQTQLEDTRPSDSKRRAIIVAGGIGSASVLMLAEELSRSKVDTQIFFGAASKQSAIGCGLEDFRSLALPFTITTDDGSLGEKGFVTAPFENYLREGGSEDSVVYTCGPWIMMRRVAEICEKFSVKCYASLEAPMGCGFGVCVGCVVAVKTDEPLGYHSYKRVCIDGSIFPAEAIQWEVEAMTH
jgi:dihydroorotate dehydrogenase electron transfer subunit